MFNDERINIECGKIYSKGILLTVLVTLLYTISRTITLIIQGEFKTPVTYTEAVILILGIGILLTGFFRFNKDRDERTVYERHTFYKNLIHNQQRIFHSLLHLSILDNIY